jgi:histidyl-tRNA synthetase
VTIWNEETIADSLELANELRAQGLRVSVYPEADKLGKQFKYASTIGVSAVAVIGDEERANRSVTIKYLETGTQETISRENLATELKI